MKYIQRILLCVFLATSFAPAEADASRLWDFFYKRFFKRNKLKKLAPKLMPGETPLDVLSITGGYEVIGYEPSWMLTEKKFGEKNYYFNLLTTLVTGEYDIHPITGAPRDQRAIDLTYSVKTRDDVSKQILNIYQRAESLNPKIQFLLQLNFSNDIAHPRNKYDHELNVFGSNSAELHAEVFRNLGQHYDHLRVKEKISPDRTGVLVNIDFIDPGLDKTYFKEFLSALREKHPENLIYLSIPPYLGQGTIYPLDFIRELIEEEIVDKFVLKGYGFEQVSRMPTHTVVFDSYTEYSVDATIRRYTDFNEELDKEYEEPLVDEDGNEISVEEPEDISDLVEQFKAMLVIEFPYYGTVWERENQYEDNWELSTSTPYISIETFHHDSRILGRSGRPKLTRDSFALFYDVNNKRYFSEDSLTLGRKIEYLIDSLGLKGIGLNALGYSTRSIERKYKFDGTLKGNALIWKAFANNGSLMTKKEQKFGWIIAYFIAAFLPIGFVYSVLNYWEVRNALAKHKKYYTRFKYFFFLFVFIFLVVADILPRDTIGLIIGLIIVAALLIYILVKKVIIRSKKYVNALK